MRILVVTHYRPYPPDSGQPIRVFNLLTRLAANHALTLITYAEPSEVAGLRDLERRGIMVHPIDPPSRRDRATRRGQLRSLLSSGSFQCRHVYSRHMQTAIDQCLADGAFDLVQVESSLLSRFRFAAGAPVVLDTINIEYEIRRRTAETARSPLARVYNWLEFWKLRREERAFWRRVQGCMVTSAREAEIIAATPGSAPTAVVPNGVDLEYLTPTGVEAEAGTIMFSGLMSYRPNFTGVEFFLREIWPLIRRAEGDTRMIVVGRDGEAAIRAFHDSGVAATGWVPDTRPFFERAAVVVVPLLVGSGTRLKVLEALAMGKAVVTTTIGCEGLEVRDWEHVLVADRPAEFAAAVLRLLRDRDLRERLGRNGRALVERRYGWDSIGAELERFHSRIVSHWQPVATCQGDSR